MTTPPATVRVVAGVIVDDGEYLLARRAPGRTFAGLWEFPGGKVEQGEAPDRALQRELREELGIDITVHGSLHRSATNIGRMVIDLECFSVRMLGGRPSRSTDHDLLRWVPQSQLAAFQWCPPDAVAVAFLGHGGEPNAGRSASSLP